MHLSAFHILIYLEWRTTTLKRNPNKLNFYAQCSAEHLQLFQLLLYSQCSLEFFSIVQYSTVHWKISEWLQESHFLWHLLQIWNINSWDVTFNPLLFWIAPGLISCIFIWINKKKNQCGTIYFKALQCLYFFFEHYQLWMMDSKAQRVFFPKTPKMCVWHTEVRNCYHFKLVSHFQLWFTIWGVLVNRLNSWSNWCPPLTSSGSPQSMHYQSYH